MKFQMNRKLWDDGSSDGTEMDSTKHRLFRWRSKKCYSVRGIVWSIKRRSVHQYIQYTYTIVLKV